MNSLQSLIARLILVTVSLPPCGWVTALSQTMYTVTDLGTFGGSSYAYGLNNSGQVVGYSEGVNNYHAFLWENGVLTDLGTLGGSGSAAYGINSSSQVVGYSFLPGDATYHACLWGNGSIEDLGTLGGPNSFASGINTSTRVVGISYFPNFPIDSARAFFWEDGTMTDLGTLGGSSSYGFAISPFSSRMVGSSDLLDGSSHAYIWDNGTMTDLGTLGGANSNAYGINSSSQVVGQTNTFDGSTHAFLSEGPVMDDLGTLGGTSSVAYGINTSGKVVGFSTPPNNQPRAFLWENGVMSDLNSMIDPDSGWTLIEARGINDNGAIVGYGIHNGQTRAFILTLVTVDVDEHIDYGMPAEYSLSQNYPNPFNPSTTITYRLPAESHVTGTILNLLGQEVVTLLDEVQPAGNHTVRWDGRNSSGRAVGSGVYIYRVQATGTLDQATSVGVRRMVLLR